MYKQFLLEMANVLICKYYFFHVKQRIQDKSVL